MRVIPKLLLTFFLFFLVADILIFIFRNNGFEYTKYSGIGELYPDQPDNSFLIKWNRCNQQFSDAEIKQGITLLKKYTGIDTVPDEKEKIMKIASWLYRSFFAQMGTPDGQLSQLSPLQQYKYLETNEDKKLWCGHFQHMFGFFCTVAGFQNRYVEIAPVKESVGSGYHEVNEVYLPSLKQWIMVDITRNFFLIRKNELIFSAAQYLNYRLSENPDPLTISCYDKDSILPVSYSEGKFSTDVYFNKHYFLRYYLNMNFSEVYSPFQKVKRYILPSPWYEIYGPQLSHSNFLFRVKQFFFYGTLLLVLVIISRILMYKYRIRRSRI